MDAPEDRRVTDAVDRSMTRDATLVAYRTVSDVAAKAAFLVITVLAARRLTQDGFGAFALGSTAGWLATVVSDAGIQLHLARAVARQPADAASLLHRWLRLRLQLASAATLLVVAVCASGLVPHPAAVALFALVYLAGGLVEFLHHFYRGLGRSDIESTITIALRGVTLVSAVMALLWRPEPVVLAVALLWPTVIALMGSAALAVRLARGVDAGAGDGANAAAGVTERQRFWHDVAPIGAGIALSALYFRVDVFLLEAWQGIESVAVYAAVFRLVEALRLFPAAVLAVALPAMCRTSGLHPLKPVAAGLTLFAATVAALLWLPAGWIVDLLYGPRYAAGVQPFRILLLSFPLMSLNYALTQQLIGWNRHHVFAGLCATALVANLAANVRLIPAMGLEGAAWATLITEVVLAAGCVLALTAHRRGTRHQEVAAERTRGQGAGEGRVDAPALKGS